MSPLDATTVADSATTPHDVSASPLSASEIAALVKAVSQALARGQSVTILSEGRILARLLPTRDDEKEAGLDRPGPEA